MWLKIKQRMMTGIERMYRDAAQNTGNRKK